MPMSRKQPDLAVLGARERQIIDVLFRLESASVAEVRDALASPPTYSTVRAMLGLLEQKGYVSHRRDGLRYLYAPTLSQSRARRRALKHLVSTFFGGSPELVVSALLGLDDATPVDLERLREHIERQEMKE
ncbi:MAG: BlaI/MecI/CopY family transcriptional regulator [bacterium]